MNSRGHSGQARGHEAERTSKTSNRDERVGDH